MNNLHRVFYHELGHFVSREYNKRYFRGTGSDELLIFPCKEDFREYCGHVRPIRPDDYNEQNETTVPIERLAEHLATNLYGCIFQAYYLNNELSVCTGPKGNGNDDFIKWFKSLAYHKLDKRTDDMFDLTENHFQNLKQSNLLEQFIQLTPENYLTEEPKNHFSANLPKLLQDIEEALNTYSTVYRAFVGQYQTMIDTQSL